MNLKKRWCNNNDRSEYCDPHSASKVFFGQKLQGWKQVDIDNVKNIPELEPLRGTYRGPVGHGIT